jgi:cobalt transporter subunit CbtB
MAIVKISTVSLSISQRMAAGATMVFMVGLSHISAAHNAAHNTRHSLGFPCH